MHTCGWFLQGLDGVRLRSIQSEWFCERIWEMCWASWWTWKHRPCQNLIECSSELAVRLRTDAINIIANNTSDNAKHTSDMPKHPRYTRTHQTLPQPRQRLPTARQTEPIKSSDIASNTSDSANKASGIAKHTLDMPTYLRHCQRIPNMANKTTGLLETPQTLPITL